MTGKFSRFPVIQNYVRVLTLKELPPALFVHCGIGVLGKFHRICGILPGLCFHRNEYWENSLPLW